MLSQKGGGASTSCKLSKFYNFLCSSLNTVLEDGLSYSREKTETRLPQSQEGPSAVCRRQSSAFKHPGMVKSIIEHTLTLWLA